MNLLVLKNFRSFGSDGLLLRAALDSPNDWYVIALVDHLSDFSNVDSILYNSPLVVKKIKKSDLLGRVFSNISVFLSALFFRLRHRNVGHIVCGSVELAFVVQFIFLFSEKKYYLFSDLTRFHLGRFSSVVQFLERSCLRNGWIPCVTSPGFVSGYLNSLSNKVGAFLVHNVDPEMSIRPDSSSFDAKVIVWAGLLRCSDSIDIFKKMLDYKTGFSFRLAGTIDCLEPKKIADLLNNNQVEFRGKYVSSDLNSIYDGCTFSWCCDWSLGVNSKLLLTNRLYQSIAACIPILASEGSFTSLVVEHYNIGLVVPRDPELAAKMISEVDEAKYLKLVLNIKKLATEKNMKNPWISVFSEGGVVVNDSACNGAIFN